MIKTTVLSIFDSMTDEVLAFDMGPEELMNLCNALSLDLQLLEENNSSNYEC